MIARLLLLLFLLPGCPEPEVPAIEEILPPGDAGDELFVRRVTPLMWGRHPLGIHEVDVLVQALGTTTRADFVRRMTRSFEYHRRWEAVLEDALFVNRIGDRANTRCFTREGHEDEDGDDLVFDPSQPPMPPDVAAWVRDHGPDDPDPPPIWTMSELIRSAITLDDLSPVYRANLFAQLARDRAPLDEAENLDLRRNLSGVMMETYLNRNADCMPCHNGEFSVTGHEDPALDRTWEVPGLFEQALFGVSEGLGVDAWAGLARRDGVLVGFEEHAGLGAFDGCQQRDEPGCDGCVCEASVCADRPTCCTGAWDSACANLCDQFNIDQGNAGICVPGVPPDFEGCTPVANLPGCGGCACEQAVCDVIPLCCERSWHQGCAELCEETGFCTPEPEPNPEDVPGVHVWGMHYTCGTFEPEPGPDPLGQSVVLGGELGTAASAWDAEALLHSGVDSLRTGLELGGDGRVAPDQAFAWLLAMGFVDVAWDEAFGQRLTVAHSFPRNREQRDELQRLTEAFVADGYSLRELLVGIATTPWFNPKAPLDEEQTARSMPPIFDPWVVDGQADADLARNGVGDQIGRWPGRVLDTKIARALEWPPLPDFPGATNSDEYRVYEDLGLFLKDSTQGFEGTDVQFLAAWEAYMTTCVVDTWEAILSPDDAGGDIEEDWITGLVEQGEGRPLGDLVSALKDRLLADPDLSDPDERALLEALLGRPLEAEADAGTDERLRRVCGAFLASPQFLLRGLPVQRLGAEPGFVVGGTSFRDQCELIGGLLFDSVSCSADALSR